MPMISLVANREKNIHRLSHAVLSVKLNMDKKLYCCISENIYRTLQEHREATLELEKIKISKGHAFTAFMSHGRNGQSSFRRTVSQL